MIHYFNIFHAKQLDSLFSNPGRFPSAASIYLDEIFVITIKPFPSSSVNLDYIGIDAVNFFLQFIDPITIVILCIGLLLSCLFLVLFDLFDLVIDLRWMIEHGLVDKQINILLNRLFHLG